MVKDPTSWWSSLGLADSQVPRKEVLEAFEFNQPKETHWADQDNISIIVCQEVWSIFIYSFIKCFTSLFSFILS